MEFITTAPSADDTLTLSASQSTIRDDSSKPHLSPWILAVIDMGTTAIRIMIVKMYPQFQSSKLEILYRAEQPIHWGDPATQQLSEAAMQLGIDCLKQYCEIAKRWGAKEEAIVVIATSAIREAGNCNEFVQKVQRALGLTIHIVTGEEEAHLIFRGVLLEREFAENLQHIIIDIGGGSTELILGTGKTPQVVQSLPVGAVRLTDEWVTTDPISESEFNDLRALVRKSLDPAVEAIQRRLNPNQPPRLVGTSRGVIALAAVHARDRLKVPGSLDGYILSYKDVMDLVNRLCGQSTRELSTLPELSTGLPSIIVAGAVILQEAMTLLRANHITVSKRTLMEGVVDIS